MQMKNKSKYNVKFYNSVIGKVYVRVTNKICDLYDYHYDKKICNRSLIKYIPSVDSDKYTGSQSTRYWVLEHLFENANFTENDSFVEIGCGKGRVIAYLINSNAKCKITGVELNEKVANYCSEWIEQYDDINIICDDAMNLKFDEYTVLFLARPFLPEVFESFISKIESELTHSITLYYWVDQQSGDFLNDRVGWSLVKRRWLFRKHKLCISKVPQRYSIWTYSPKK